MGKQKVLVNIFVIKANSTSVYAHRGFVCIKADTDVCSIFLSKVCWV